MAHIQTKDPFGFVGSHIVQHAASRSPSQRKRGKRRQRAPSSNAMKPDPGAEEEQEDLYETAEDEAMTTSDGMVLHGWLTRYDARLDTYTLFIPGVGTSLHSRGDVMKFVSNPEFQMRSNSDPLFPPPVEDTTSRFVGAPMRKEVVHTAAAEGHADAVAVAVAAVNGKKRRTSSSSSRRSSRESGNCDTVAVTVVSGRVACFLPFADLYRVEYEDGSAAEVSERVVVDELLSFVQRTQAERAAQQVEAATERMRRQESEDSSRKTSNSKKRRRGGDEHEDFGAATRSESQHMDDDDGDETEDEQQDDFVAISNGHIKQEEPPDGSHGGSVSGVIKSETTTTTEPAAPTTEDAGVVQVDSSAWQDEGATATAADDDFMPEFASVDDDEPMELLPIDDEDDDDHVNTTRAALGTTTPAQPAQPPVVEVVSLVDDEDEDDASLTTATSLIRASLAQFYVIPEEPTRPAIQPFDKRAQAFEVLRQQLIKLVECDECTNRSNGPLDTSLVSDVLHNKDIKDRDAVRRFVETGGLVVLNIVLNARASDVLVTPRIKYENVLLLLKILAMLPTPTTKQVLESSIGKTVGRLVKSRLRETSQAQDKNMPKCIAHLAKWVKQKWISNMHRDEKQKKPPVYAPSHAAAAHAQAQAQAQARATGSTNKQKKKHLQRPQHGRPPGHHVNDTEPIPRLATRPTGSSSSSSSDVLGQALAARPAPLPAASSASSATSSGASASAAVHGRSGTGIRPDWMRQKDLLARTRFTITTDTAAAERHHYQRDHRDRANAMSMSMMAPPPSITPFGSSSSTTTTATRHQDDEATGGGDPRGVFGRIQRLSFGAQWNVCEFYKDAPPRAVGPPTPTPSGSHHHHHHHHQHSSSSSSNTSAYGRSSSSSSSSTTSNGGRRPSGATTMRAAPVSILRKTSKYHNDLSFE